MNSLKFTMACVSVALLSWASWTCKDQVDGPGGGDIVFPATGVSYGKQVEPLFNQRCGGQSSQCHGADTYEAFNGFSLDSYQHLRNRVDIIVQCFPNQPCDPELSVLVRRIDGLDGKEKMPPPGSPGLTTNQINGIKQWIREFAQNN